MAIVVAVVIVVIINSTAVIAALSGGIDGHCIKTAADGFGQSMPIKIILGRENDIFLFFAGNRICGRSIAAAAAVANFDKNQLLPIAHNQIDFTAATAKVTGHMD